VVEVVVLGTIVRTVEVVPVKVEVEVMVEVVSVTVTVGASALRLTRSLLSIASAFSWSEVRPRRSARRASLIAKALSRLMLGPDRPEGRAWTI